ncbi:diphthamide biosynthesis enzyme Dph2 [Stetteria hydrogenophila]
MECRVGGYVVDAGRVAGEARRRGARRILLQLPDGLKPLSRRLAECLERATGAEVVVHGDSVFGACDLQLGKASLLKPDLIVHVGHTPYPPELADGSEPPDYVVFDPAFYESSVPAGVVEEAAGILARRGVGRVAVVGSVQHARILPSVAEALRGAGVEAEVPRGDPPFFLDGQVLGCDYRVALRSRADGFVFVGGGLFHPLGLYLATRKPVVKIDPYTLRVEDVTPTGERFLKVRLFKVSQAMGSKRWGIILGLKTGQYRPWLYSRLKRLMDERGVEYRVYAAEATGADLVRSIDEPWFEAFVVTSCPRIPIDDVQDYPKPVLTPGEAVMALRGELSPYRFPW